MNIQMLSRKANSKPMVSQFSISNPNNADIIMEDRQWNIGNSNPSTKTPFTFQQATQLLKSKAQQNNDSELNYDQPKLSHRQSRGGLDFMKKKLNSHLNQNTKNHPVGNQNDNRVKDMQINQLMKKFQGLDCIVKELTHHIEEVDKRSSTEIKNILSQNNETKSTFKDSFFKMTSQIKLKFTSQDKLIESLRCDIDSLQKGFIEPSIPNVATVNSMQFKSKQLEKEIVYGLDVKSSLDGLQYQHNPKDNSQQLNYMKNQIDILRQEISKQDNNKSKQQYEKLRTQIQSLSVIIGSKTEQKITQCQRVIKDHDQVIQKINLEFQKVINEQIRPRIMSIEESVRLIPETIGKYDSFKKILDECTIVKNDLQEKLKSSEVISVKKGTLAQTETIKKLNGLEMSDTYFLDEEKYLMDSRANYILGEDNKRIKIQDSQIYFLNLHGISIMNIQ